MQKFNKERRTIFVFAIFFTLLGMLMIYESSSIYAWKLTSDSAYFLKRQFIYFILSLFLFGGVLTLDLNTARKYCRPMLIINMVLLFFVLCIGKQSGGAKRWLNILGFNFQPSEFLKISFLLYCADYFQRKGALIRSFKEGVLPLLVVSGCVFSLVIIEPDLGTVIFWAIWLFVMFFLLNAKKKHLLFILSAGLLMSVVLIVLYPYRFSRITSYVNPWRDPRGSGFQLVQSQIAYGTGGIFGVGLGESKQKLFYLPAAHTDFIFSIIAEEFGYLGSIIMLGAFAIFLFKILKMGFFPSNSFLKNICVGIGIIVGLEIVINIGVSCGLFPTKGLPLPFVSYGGSNLVVHYILLGLLFNASRGGSDTDALRLTTGSAY